VKLIEIKSSLSVKIDINSQIISCDSFFLEKNTKEYSGKNFSEYCEPKDRAQFIKLIKKLSRNPHASTLTLSLIGYGNVLIQLIPVTRKPPVKYFFIIGNKCASLGSFLKPTKLFESVADSLNEKVGEQYFKSIVKQLALNLEADFACISQYEKNGEESLKLVTLYSKDIKVGNVNFRIKGSPCIEIKKGQVTLIEKNLKELFPDNELVKIVSAKALAGIPLHSAEGETLGFLILMYREKIKDTSLVKSMLSIVANRISSELERQITEQKLIESQKNLLTIIENVPDVIMKITPEGTIEFINYTLPDYGIKDVIGSSVFEYLSENDTANYKRAILDACKNKQVVSFNVSAAGPSEWYIRLAPLINGNEVLSLMVIASNLTDKINAEKESKKHQQHYALAQWAANIGSWEWIIESDKLYWSETLEPMFGLKFGEFGGKYSDYIDLIFIEDKTRVNKTLQDSIYSGDSFKVEHRILWPNNEIRWLSLNAKIITDLKENSASLIGVFQDITRSKQHEQALIESETKWRTLLESAPDFIALINQQGIVLYVNRVLAGYDIKSFIGTSIFDYADSEHHQAMTDAISQVFDRGEIATYSFPAGTPGEMRHYVNRLAPINYGNSVQSAILFVTDVTGQMMVKSELKQSQKRFQYLVESSFDGYWDWPDASKEEMWWSPRLYELLEYENDQSLASISRFSDLLLSEDKDRVIGQLRSHLHDGEKFDIEFQLKTQSSGYTWFRLRGQVIQPSDKQSPHLSGSIQNIDELQKHREHLEDLVLERTKALALANKELESFSYSVSHDLRAPLRSIDGFSTILLEDFQPKMNLKEQDYLRRICDNAQKMGDLIDDLLKLSRVTSSPFARETVDLSQIATETISKLKGEEPERLSELVIQSDVKGSGDKRLLSIALENLLNNAWKYTSKSSISEIEFGQLDKNDNIVYYIRDNGSGFDMRYSDRLFGAFQRLHKENEFPGTGIGLATVQRIIRRHGGDIWAESRENEGSTFYFTLN